MRRSCVRHAWLFSTDLRLECGFKLKRAATPITIYATTMRERHAGKIDRTHQWTGTLMNGTQPQKQVSSWT